MALAVVPTSIDQLLSNPTLADTLPPTVAFSLLVVLAARLAKPDPAVAAPVAQDEDDDSMVTKDAADLLKIAVVTLRRAKDEEPYCQFRISMGTKKLLRWSRRRIQAHLAKNPGPVKRGAPNRRTDR